MRHTASIKFLLRGSVSAGLPSGRRFPEINLEELRPNYYRETGPGKNTLRVVAPPNDSPESGSGK